MIVTGIAEEQFPSFFCAVLSDFAVRYTWSVHSKVSYQPQC